MGSQTIRAYIKRRTLIVLAIIALDMICIALVAYIFQPDPKVLIWAIPFFMGTWFAASLYLVWFVRCPQCSGNVGQTISMAIAFPWRGRAIKFCPYCGVSLDEPIKGGTDARG